MPFRIEFSPEADAHLDAFRKFDQTRILHSIEDQLVPDPVAITRRKKEMRSNLIATRELRTGEFRIYYDVDVPRRVVLIRAIGQKRHNQVFIGGEEFDFT